MKTLYNEEKSIFEEDGKMIAKKIIICVCLLSFAQFSFCQDNYILSGTQSKQGQRFSTKLESEPVVLPQKGIIIKVTGGRSGFWVNKKEGYHVKNVYKFWDPKDAIGKALEAGVYTVYPNLPKSEDYQSVSVHIKPGNNLTVTEEGKSTGNRYSKQKRDKEEGERLQNELDWESEEKNSGEWDF